LSSKIRRRRRDELCKGKAQGDGREIKRSGYFFRLNIDKIFKIQNTFPTWGKRGEFSRGEVLKIYNSLGPIRTEKYMTWLLIF